MVVDGAGEAVTDAGTDDGADDGGDDGTGPPDDGSSWSPQAASELITAIASKQLPSRPHPFCIGQVWHVP